MQFRVLIPWLGAAAISCGAETPVSPEQLDQAREVLRNSNGDLAQLAKLMLGKNGGNQLFYFPTRDEPTTPARWGLRFEEVDFSSGDGTRLHGWFLPAKGKAPKATVVFSHGNAGSIGHHLGFVAWMVEAGYNVLMYDYRGFGKSEGSVDRRGMLDDVKAAFAYVAERKDVDADRIISYGHSLGGAKSVTALAESPMQGLRAVVIDGAFASYREMARIVAGKLGEELVTDDWAPLEYVGRITPVPLLVVHGDKDEVVPVSQGLRLFEKANEPKTLFAVSNGHHGDALYRNNGAYRKKMISWLDEQLGQ